MNDDNKRNVVFFQAKSMRELYNTMDEWQLTNHKRFLHTSIEKDCDDFYCIALTNPSEVVITDLGGRTVDVTNNGELMVRSDPT